MLEATHNISKSAEQVKSSSEEMLDQSKLVNDRTQALAELSMEIEGALHEVVAGTDQISISANDVNDLVETALERVNRMTSTTSQFKVS